MCATAIANLSFVGRRGGGRRGIPNIDSFGSDDQNGLLDFVLFSYSRKRFTLLEFLVNWTSHKRRFSCLCRRVKRHLGTTKGWADAQLQKEVARLDLRSGTIVFEPYVEVLLYWLRKRIDRI